MRISRSAVSLDLVTPLMAVTANCDVLEGEAPDRADLPLDLQHPGRGG